MLYDSSNFPEKPKPILQEIDEAADEILIYRPDRIIPVSKNFTIVRHDTTINGDPICEYQVFSYRKLVAFVTFSPKALEMPIIHVVTDAFEQSRTTSKHLRRLITALLAPSGNQVNWDELDRRCADAQLGGASTALVPLVEN